MSVLNRCSGNPLTPAKVECLLRSLQSEGHGSPIEDAVSRLAKKADNCESPTTDICGLARVLGNSRLSYDTRTSKNRHSILTGASNQSANALPMIRTANKWKPLAKLGVQRCSQLLFRDHEERSRMVMWDYLALRLTWLDGGLLLTLMSEIE